MSDEVNILDAKILSKEYFEKRSDIVEKINNGEASFNNIGEDGGPTMDYRIQSYDDYGAHGPIKPIVITEGD